MKRIIICLILLVVIVFEFVAYRSERTKAEQVIDVEVLIGDYDEKLDETKLPLKATYSDNGYYIILPESLDNKTVIKYYAEVPIETTVGLVNS